MHVVGNLLLLLLALLLLLLLFTVADDAFPFGIVAVVVLVC